jgi:hypothetical protein
VRSPLLLRESLAGRPTGQQIQWPVTEPSEFPDHRGVNAGEVCYTTMIAQVLDVRRDRRIVVVERCSQLKPSSAQPEA